MYCASHLWVLAQEAGAQAEEIKQGDWPHRMSCMVCGEGLVSKISQLAGGELGLCGPCWEKAKQKYRFGSEEEGEEIPLVECDINRLGQVLQDLMRAVDVALLLLYFKEKEEFGG